MDYVAKTRLRVLVVVGSYGTANDRYLRQVIHEYQSMPFEVDIVILSDRTKEVNPSVQLLVGLPSRDPWSLPFAHKKVFASRVEDYDIFIYSDDDILITERNIRAFLDVSSCLQRGEIAGFFLKELRSNNELNYPQVHAHFHWDAGSVRVRDKYTVAYFTNEHSACYVLTQSQLRTAIESGGFLVEPHEWKYDLLCSAVTDPYTQCGYQKLIPISHLDDFTVVHLPAKYVGKYGIDALELRTQISALMQISASERRPTSLFDTETKLKYRQYSKDYYEPLIDETISAIPRETRSVLSIGCGWGKTESNLSEKGIRVVGVPIDPVICCTAQAKGVEMVFGSLQAARAELKNDRFDCLLYLNVLQFFADPVKVLTLFADALSSEGTVIVQAPNTWYYKHLKENVRSLKSIGDFGNFDRTGMHSTSIGKIRSWCNRAGLQVEKINRNFPKKSHTRNWPELRLLSSFFMSDFVAVAKRRSY